VSEPDPVDPRVILALERTLLAWTRTALALMGFGFVVARLALFLRELNPLTPPARGFSQWLGVSLVILGAVVQLAAIAAHARSVRRLRAGTPLPLQTVSPATILGVFLIVLAVAVALYLAMLT
jgi:putative membrane protein